MKVLVVNCGSSSIKYQLINMENEEVMAKGYLEKIGLPDSFLTHTVNGEKHRIEKVITNHEDGISFRSIVRCKLWCYKRSKRNRCNRTQSGSWRRKI